MEFYSAVKKNESMIFEGKWMEVEIIMSRKISQTQPNSVFSLMYKTYIQMCICERKRVRGREKRKKEGGRDGE